MTVELALNGFLLGTLTIDEVLEFLFGGQALHLSPAGRLAASIVRTLDLERQFGIERDDYINEAWIVLASRLESLQKRTHSEPVTDGYAWLKTVLLNHAYDVVSAQKAKKRGRSVEKVDIEDGWQEASANPVSGHNLLPPERNVQRAQLLQRLELEMSAWPEPQRAAFQLYYLRGFKVPEIASVMGVAPGAVYGLITRGRYRFERVFGSLK